MVLLDSTGWHADRHVDPLTSQLPLINKPSEPLFLILAYLIIVITYAGCGLPWHACIWPLCRWREILVAKQSSTKGSAMPVAKSHKFEFTLQNMVVVCHNLFLTGLSLYMCLGCFSEAIKNNFALFGNAYSASHKSLAWVIYVFYVRCTISYFAPQTM